MSDYIFEVGDVVRLSGTYYMAIIIAGPDKEGYYHVVEVKNDLEYYDTQNFQVNRWDRYDMELLIPIMEAKEFPKYDERGEA